MKTLTRILIILTAFAITMGVVYLAVNATASSSAAGPAFERREGFSPKGEGGGVTGLTFGMLKNIGIVAMLVALITIPKEFRQKRKH